MARTTSRKNSVKSWLLIVLILFTIIAVIGGTYARYTNTATGTATIDVAKWQVKIDDTAMNSIASGELSVPLTYATNAYVSDDKLAPGRSATFTLVIDPTESEVAIDYTISLGAITGLVSGTTSEVALTSATYTIEPDEGDDPEVQNATITSGASTITCSETLADVEAGKTITIVGTITWTNNEAKNADDTANGWTDPDLTAAVTITAQQHLAADD